MATRSEIVTFISCNDVKMEEAEEEIIIETEVGNDEDDEEAAGVAAAAHALVKTELDEDDDDDDFRWDEDDPFKMYDPPTRKMKRPRKRRGDADDGGASKVRGAIQKYKTDWEKIPQFKKWLSVSLIGQEYFYCKLCKIDAKCGKSEIMRHMISKKHARNSQSTIPKKKNFEGLICPVFTPLEKPRTGIEEVNYTKIIEYASCLRRENVKAVIVNDIVGEGMNLSVSERCLITEEWVKACDKYKMYLMVQVGGAPLKDVIRLVRHALMKKVNAISILPDCYNRPEDHYDLLRYIKIISDYADTLPIWYHHCPKYTNVNIDMKKFMADVSEIESFVGVIFNTGNMEEAISASTANPKLMSIYATDNGILGAGVQGFKSIMSVGLNFIPKHVIEAFRSATGETALASDAQRIINSVFDIINEQGHPISAMKCAMNIITRVQVGQVRPPLVEIWKKQLDQMHTELKAAGVI